MPEFTVFKGGLDGIKRSKTVKPDALTGDLVLVKVTASGVCGTDLHHIHRDMVLGHEGVGVVQAVGPNVQALRLGDRVGWGYETNSCGQCLECLSGDEIYCRKRETFGRCNLDQGSFASHAVWREAFLHKIPAGINDEDAAPLQCAGATVFSALHEVRPGETVGVIGVGGLGHLAIQFAAKMGCRVVVLSSSDRKKEDAMALGAHKFIVTTGSGEANGAGGTSAGETLEDEWLLSRLLVTTSALPNWAVVLPLMGARSTIYPITASSGNVEIPSIPLTSKGMAVQGLLTASRGVHRRMLDFAALHGIRPLIERFAMDEAGIREAIERLESGKIRYRAVLIPR